MTNTYEYVRAGLGGAGQGGAGQGRAGQGRARWGWAGQECRIEESMYGSVKVK